MDDAFLACLRCPIDPTREATLIREQQSLICSGCRVTFPIKNGLPVLIPDEADLPAGLRHRQQLPCLRGKTPPAKTVR